MTNPFKYFLSLSLMVAATPLASQELWDPHFKLTAGLVTNAEGSYIGQNKAYGVVLAGAYPLTIRGAGVLEGGWKIMPTSSEGSGLTTVKDDSDIYFLGAMYRHEIWRNGLYLQGGIRGTNAKTTRQIVYKGAGEGGTDASEKFSADREVRFGWCLGVGYRLTDLWSFEVGASTVGFKNVLGEAKSGMLVEVALVIHR